MSHAPAVLGTQAADAAAGNRLRIAHFLLWLAATAIILTAFRPALIGSTLQAPVRQGDDQEARFAQFGGLLAISTIAPIWGAGLAGVLLAGWRRLSGGAPFPRHPGHWLLLVIGTGVLSLLPVPLLVRLGEAAGREHTSSLAACAAFLLPLATLVVAIRRLRGIAPWQVLFLALAISLGAMLLGLAWDAAARLRGENEFMLMLMGFAWSIVFAVALMATSAADLCQQRRYDALHWIGISLLPAHAMWLILVVAFGGA